jgi:hypothetical protein
LENGYIISKSRLKDCYEYCSSSLVFDSSKRSPSMPEGVYRVSEKFLELANSEYFPHSLIK